MRMVLNFILASLLFCIHTAQALPFVERLGGVDVGNGGDLLLCKIDAQNTPVDAKEAIFFSLDYVHEIQFRPETELAFFNISVESNKNKQPCDFENDPGEYFMCTGALSKNLSSIDKYIIQNLQQKAPDLGKALLRFHNEKFNIHNDEKQYIWQGSFNVPQIADEELVKHPNNCNIIQAVERTVRSGKIYFTYNVAGFLALEFVPLQKSFLLIHEWLWNYTSSAKKIRAINWFLHSKEAFALSPVEFRARIDKMLSYE